MRIRQFALLLLLPMTALAQPGNRGECILQMMSGVQNDVVADAVVDYCKERFYGSKYDPKPLAPAQRAYDSAIECTLERAGSLHSEVASKAVRDACRALYRQ